MKVKKIAEEWEIWNEEEETVKSEEEAKRLVVRKQNDRLQFILFLFFYFHFLFNYFTSFYF